MGDVVFNQSLKKSALRAVFFIRCKEVQPAYEYVCELVLLKFIHLEVAYPVRGKEREVGRCMNSIRCGVRLTRQVPTLILKTSETKYFFREDISMGPAKIIYPSLILPS